MDESFGRALREALAWAGVLVATVVVGFCAGYWIGHREITGMQTLTAFVSLPLLWLAFPRLLLAFAVTGLAWYLPRHYESRRPRIRIVAAGVNLGVWLVIVLTIVE